MLAPSRAAAMEALSISTMPRLPRRVAAARRHGAGGRAAAFLGVGDGAAERGFSVREAGEEIMESVFECGSVVPGCRFVIHADERDEVLAKAIEHMHSFHEIEHLSEPLKARIRAAIREEWVERTR